MDFSLISRIMHVALGVKAEGCGHLPQDEWPIESFTRAPVLVLEPSYSTNGWPYSPKTPDEPPHEYRVSIAGYGTVRERTRIHGSAHLRHYQPEVYGMPLPDDDLTCYCGKLTHES